MLQKKEVLKCQILDKNVNKAAFTNAVNAVKKQQLEFIIHSHLLFAESLESSGFWSEQRTSSKNVFSKQSGVRGAPPEKDNDPRK
jgi:hypothetical protein